MSQLAFLSIFPATPDQVIASRKRSSVQWAKGLTLEQYLHRDASLDVMTHAIDGKLTTWYVLIYCDQPVCIPFEVGFWLQEMTRQPSISNAHAKRSFNHFSPCH